MSLESIYEPEGPGKRQIPWKNVTTISGLDLIYEPEAIESVIAVGSGGVGDITTQVMIKLGTAYLGELTDLSWQSSLFTY